MIQFLLDMELDDLDRKILALVQREGRISNAELARRIDLSPPATHARLRRLEESGYIRDYVALLDPARLGFDMLCFISISLQTHQWAQVQDFRDTVLSMPEVLECHHVTGEFDYLLKVVIRDRKDLERFVVHHLTPLPGVARIYTSLVMTEVKVKTQIPLEGDVPTH